MDEKYTDLAVKVEGIDARSKSNAHRIEDLECDMKKTKEMQVTLVKLANGVENMGNQIMSVKEDIQDVKNGQKDLSNKVISLENQPAKESKRKTDAIIEKITWLFVGGVTAWMLSQILPNIKW